jgi:hypothetical protein
MVGFRLLPISASLPPDSMSTFALQKDGVQNRSQPDPSLGEHHLDHLVVADLSKIFGRIKLHHGVARIPVCRPSVGAVDGVNLLRPSVRTGGKVCIFVERDISRSERRKLDGLRVKAFYVRIHHVCQIFGNADNRSGKTALDPLQSSAPCARRIVRIRIAGCRAFEPLVSRSISPPSPDALGDDESDVGIKDGADERRFELSAEKWLAVLDVSS